MKKLSDKELLNELKNRFLENQRNLNELKVLNDQLMDVNLKLVESEKLKSHFLSNIRNEIINPLSSILSLSKNITNSNISEHETNCLQAQYIFDDAFNLNLQLNNIFASAEIEAGELIPEFYDVDIVALIQAEINRFTELAAKKQLGFDFENQLTSNDKAFIFRTNPEKLKMVISNLMVNAVSWSEGKNKIIIRAKTGDNKLTIEVQDFGKGISPENIPLIFDRFKQLDPNIYTENRGNGLGLSIVKAYTEFLEGTIEVKSNSSVSNDKQGERGTIFIVTLPEPPEGTDLEGFSSGGQEFLF